MIRFLSAVFPETNAQSAHRHDVSIDETLDQENDDQDASGEACLSEPLRRGPIELDEAAKRRKQRSPEERKRVAPDHRKNFSISNRAPGTGRKPGPGEGRGASKGNELE